MALQMVDERIERWKTLRTHTCTNMQFAGIKFAITILHLSKPRGPLMDTLL